MVGQAGDVQGAGEAAVVFGGGFLAEDQVEEVGVAELGVVGALDQGGGAGGELVQAEPGGVRADPGGDEFAHGVLLGGEVAGRAGPAAGGWRPARGCQGVAALRLPAGRVVSSCR